MAARLPAIRVLIVDDSDEFLAVARQWVLRQPQLALAGTARSGEEAVEVADRLRADLVLMDAVMPGIGGFEATRRIKCAGSAPWVVILSFHDSQAARHEAWAAGADGFVAKAELGRELLPLILRLVRREDDRDPEDPTKPHGLPVEESHGGGRPPKIDGIDNDSQRSGAAVAARVIVSWTEFCRGVARQCKEGGSMRGFLNTASIAAIVVAIAASAAVAGGPVKPTFIALDQSYMVPMSMTTDGSKVVGTGYFGSPAFYWTAAEGVVLLGGGCGAGTAAISGDGSTIVNCIIDDNGKAVAAKWLGGTNWQSLGSVAGAVPCDADLSSAWGIDGTGSTAVGLVWLAQQCRAHAGSWDLVSGGPATDLGSFGERAASRANAISGDGHTIAGWQDDPDTGQREGAKWVDGVESYVVTPAGDHVGEVAFVNHDGTVMAGSSLPYGTGNGWVYTPKKGFQTFGPANPIFWYTATAASSDDGSIVGGVSRDQNTGTPRGWIWTFKGGKFVWMDDYMAKNKLAAGWSIGAVMTISADGSTLAGYGIDPDGIVRGWILQNFK